MRGLPTGSGGGSGPGRPSRLLPSPQHIHPGPCTHGRRSPRLPSQERLGPDVHEITSQEKEDRIKSRLEFSQQEKAPVH